MIQNQTQNIGNVWTSPIFIHLHNLPPPRALSRRLEKTANAVFHSMLSAEMHTIGTHYSLSYTPEDVKTEETHRESTQDLEDRIANNELSAGE